MFSLNVRFGGLERHSPNRVGWEWEGCDDRALLSWRCLHYGESDRVFEGGQVLKFVAI